MDFVAHLAEAYMHSSEPKRAGKVKIEQALGPKDAYCPQANVTDALPSQVRDMLTAMGVSVVSGAMSTLGAAFFLFFPTIVFFRK